MADAAALLELAARFRRIAAKPHPSPADLDAASAWGGKLLLQLQESGQFSFGESGLPTPEPPNAMSDDIGAEWASRWFGVAMLLPREMPGVFPSNPNQIEWELGSSAQGAELVATGKTAQGSTAARAENYATICDVLAGMLSEPASNADINALLDKASEVFSLARKLGQAFQEEFTSGGSLFMLNVPGEETPRERHRNAVRQFSAAVLDLRAVIAAPPPGLEHVAAQLREAGELARRLPTMDLGELLETWPNLNQVNWDGYQAVKVARAANAPADPWAFLDEAPASDEAHDAAVVLPTELIEKGKQLHFAVQAGMVEAERLINRSMEFEPAVPDSMLDDESSRSEQPPSPKGTKKPKRSTQRGEAKAKLIAALTKHHQYADGGCLNFAPINNNELARLAGVSPGSASSFFSQQFRGYVQYRVQCRNEKTLVSALKILNSEFTPAILAGGQLSSDSRRDDDNDD